MSDSEKTDRSIDILGLKPVSDAVGHISKKTIDGIGTLLSRICLPAAEEIGLALRDRVSEWRTKNIAQTLTVAKERIDALPDGGHVHAAPRLVHEIVEAASWTDDSELQKMWAGLLASSCTADGKSQGNLLFVRLLNQLTPSEARLLRHAVEHTTKEKYPGGWIGPANVPVMVQPEDLRRIAGEDDIHRIDLELDHLRALGLIISGFDPHTTIADLTATPMALQLYARARGWRDGLEEFYGLNKPGTDEASKLA